jgi:hypothetical protein
VPDDVGLSTWVAENLVKHQRFPLGHARFRVIPSLEQDAA